MLTKEDREYLIAMLQSNLDSYDAMSGRDYTEEEIKREEEHLATILKASEKHREHKKRLLHLIESLKAD